MYVALSLFLYKVRYYCTLKQSELAQSTMEWPIPADVTIEECTDWQESPNHSPRKQHFSLQEPFSSVASFKIPIASDKLFVLSRGKTVGSIKIRYDEDGENDSENIVIGVIAHYRFQEALDNVKVCTVSKGEGKNGLGIFVSSDSRLRSSLWVC